MYVFKVSYFMNGKPIGICTSSRWMRVEIVYWGKEGTLYKRVVGGRFEENDYWYEIEIKKK